MIFVMESERVSAINARLTALTVDRWQAAYDSAKLPRAAVAQLWVGVLMSTYIVRAPNANRGSKDACVQAAPHPRIMLGSRKPSSSQFEA